MEKDILIEQLNAAEKTERIDAVKQLKKLVDSGVIKAPDKEGHTNNHVHTKYSFSPYSPAKAVWTAYMSGLDTVGIVDHDAVNGVQEFTEAGEILGVATTCGFELRTDWSLTPLGIRKINNPDQISSAYICAHGLPYNQIAKADNFLSVIRSAREKRNRAMTVRLSEVINPFGIAINYDADVLPLSYAADGGEVTERHLLYALGLKMAERFDKGKGLADFLSHRLDIALSEKQRGFLEDRENRAYEYDLLNILKGSFISGIYIDSEREEMPPVKEAVAFIKELGAIPAYCYLGDVGVSPTGDKKVQKFEDDYLEELFEECRRIGFQAIAFMPSRNTKQQLERVMELCDRYGFMQISGEDINQPRQSFICRQLKHVEFSHLIDSTWALIGHEKSATEDIKNGMFADGAVLSPETMRERIQRYKSIGLKIHTGGCNENNCGKDIRKEGSET